MFTNLMIKIYYNLKNKYQVFVDSLNINLNNTNLFECFQ